MRCSQCIAVLFAATSGMSSATAQGKLTWAGKPSVSEIRTIEFDCGDAAYKFTLSNDNKQSKLLNIERAPEHFLPEVREKMKALVAEFRIIEPLELSCGGGPNDGDREKVTAENRYENFTGTLRIDLRGYHQSSVHDAMNKCDDSGGEFDAHTYRGITLSRDSIDVDSNVIGRCFTSRANLKKATKR